MTTVLSPEIEAILAAGPEPIQWETISADLQRLYMGRSGGADGSMTRTGRAGESRSERVDRSVPVPVATMTDPGENAKGPCPEWVCFAGRNVTINTKALCPVVRAGTTSLPQLVAAGDPWLTFSRASVTELARMGIDNAVTIHGSQGRATRGAVVYRGLTDSTPVVNMLCKEMFRRLDGGFRYITTQDHDDSTFATAVTHMCANGGAVCLAADGSGCRWCQDTGKVTYATDGAPFGTVELGAYCLCSKGEWLEARDEEFDEWQGGGFVMGWPDERSVSPAIGARPSRRDRVNLSDRCGGLPERDRVERAPRVAWTPEVSRGGNVCVSVEPVTVCHAATTRIVPGVEVAPADEAVAQDSVDGSAGGSVRSTSMADPVPGVQRMLEECESPTLSSLVSRGNPYRRGNVGGVCDEWLYRNMVGALSNSEVDVTVEAELDDGQCYLAVVHASDRPQAEVLLAVWPTMLDLMQAPAVWFSIAQFTRASVRIIGGGKAHIGFDQVGGFNLFESLVSLSRSNPGVGDAQSLATLAREAAVGGGGLTGSVSAMSTVTRLGAGEPEQIRVWLGIWSAQPPEVFSDTDIYVVSRSAALLDKKGKDRLRILEGVGDSALTLVVASRCERAGMSAEEFQTARSEATSNTALTSLFIEKVPRGAVMFAADVRPHVGKIGAGALESLVGLAYVKGGIGAVEVLCENLGVFDAYFGASVHTSLGGVGNTSLRGPGKRDAVAVVMPPGHGKTHRHGWGDLCELDALCGPRSSPQLDSMRSAARRGFIPWSEYAAVWGKCLRGVVRPGMVVMVPDADIAEAAGLRVLASFVLADGVWRANLQHRRDGSYERYLECYESVSSDPDAVVCYSNGELDAALEVLLEGR